MKKEEDIFIRVIQYAVDKDEPFDLLVMFKELNMTDGQRDIIQHQILDGNLLAYGIKRESFGMRLSTENEPMVWCSAIDRFRLLEYQELNEARESSRSANKMAIFAIVISICSMLASICFSIYQINSAVKLPEKHYIALESIENSLASEEFVE